MKALTEKDIMDAAVVSEGIKIAESSVYKRYINRAVDMYEKLWGRRIDPMTLATWGHEYRNFHEWQSMTLPKMMAEATVSSSMPTLRDYGFELITALLPGMTANDVYITQPARFKNYSIFYQDFQYQTAKGATAANTDAITSLTADDTDENYTKDGEVNRTIGTGDGGTATYTLIAGQLFVPVIASSITITSIATDDTTLTAVDDGAAGFTGDVSGGSIVYATGVMSITFDKNVKNLTPVYMTYNFTGEGSETNAAEYGMTITEIQGVAEERRLRYNFSIEAQFSYRQQWGRSMDADLLATSIGEIRKEIDQDLHATANTAAKSGSSAGAVTFDRTPDTGVQYFYWREQFIDTLNEAGNLIIKATGIGDGNRVVGGLNFKQVVETIGPRAKLAPVGEDVKGSRYIGTIDNKIKCYYEPDYGDNEFMVTYRGGPLQVGLSYNPWMPLYVSDPHMLDNGKLHRYLITSSGKKIVNSKLFVQGTLSKS